MKTRNYYLAIDIGASSGRHILGWLEQGKLHLKEIYRFENVLEKIHGHWCWNLPRLFQEVLTGIKKCAEHSYVPQSMGIDTWGVDFVLLDEKGRRLGDAVAYRDSRTQSMNEVVCQKISDAELYRRTGIQKQLFNSLYQLMAIQKEQPTLLERAQHFLMIPDYLNYHLTGFLTNEYTNATTTQLINTETKTWDFELLDVLGIPHRLFSNIVLPTTKLGNLRAEIATEVGLQTKVILPATHDTGSAVLAMPTTETQAIFLSSGTWSLMGVERSAPDCSESSREHNFTNEGGYAYRYRFLKNIMGLWMLQALRRDFAHAYSFKELNLLAGIASYFPTVVDVNDPRFLKPHSMVEALQTYCREKGQVVPKTEGELLFCVYHSLAKCYAQTVQEIETLTHSTYDAIHVFGGGCQDDFLNALIARETKKKVFAGPIEATAIGNLLVQMLAAGALPTLEVAREVVANSWEIKSVDAWNEKVWREQHGI